MSLNLLSDRTDSEPSVTVTIVAEVRLHSAAATYVHTGTEAALQAYSACSLSSRRTVALLHAALLAVLAAASGLNLKQVQQLLQVVW